jgi:serine/threonine protein kinase/WD40 repeat protein
VNAPDSTASLLARLLELPAADREALLRLMATRDPELASRLSDVIPTPLAANPAEQNAPAIGTNGLAPGAVWALEAALSVTETGNSGARIGPYKLLQKVGEGGFGVVWMAEQLEPITRLVALKIIKVGMDTDEVIARFEAERQALARMEHPNIAHVFDAGATDAGRPYFVMELVRGISITRYCDENRLSAEERLRLFVMVCQAVQHAHQKGIIHRDLKPSNILVTLHDGVAVPKIIDFGIAKATSGRLTEKTLFTQFNAFIGTPAYTSPEQMEMSGLDVDTRSDIYSLGVLLYELLTGQPPFDSKALMQSGLEAMRRTIREVDPPRPSHRLGTLTEVARTSIAQHRGTDPAKLSVLLRGDLDWIAMRCLEKDRMRRYDSATSLATDVERHLSDGVVEARPPSRIYQTSRFIRRHRLGVSAGVAVAVSLIAGLIASSTLFMLERSARGRATLAEEKESELRQQAELAGAREVKRVARTALDLANQNLAGGHLTDGLAYLVYAARKDPQNTTLGPRLASALTTHNFLLPEGPAFECGSPVLAVHFTKDGRSIYVGTEDGAFRVLDAASGELRAQISLGRPVYLGGWEFPKENDTVFTVRFADKTVGVYDVKSGQPHWPSRALDPGTWLDGESAQRGPGAGISPDGRWLYALGFDRFWISDAATGEIVLRRSGKPGNWVGGCDFTRDGAEVAVTFATSVRRWTLPDGRLIPPIDADAPGPQPPQRTSGAGKPSQAILRTVNFSPNGRLLAVSGAYSGIMIFDATTGNRLRTLNIPGLVLTHTSVVFASDKRVFAAGPRVSGSWDVTTGDFTPLPIATGADVRSASFDASGSVVLAMAADGSARICALVSGELMAEPTGRQDRACAALAPDGLHVVTGNGSGTVQRFRIGRGSARPLELPRGSPTVAVFLPEPPSRLLLIKTTRARVLDLASGREIAGGFAYPTPLVPLPWAHPNPPVRSDTKFMVMPTTKGLQAWEIGASGIVNVATLADAKPRAVETWFSPRGDLLAISTGFNNAAVWNLRTGVLAGPRISVPDYIRTSTLQFSPDGGRLVFGKSDGDCLIVDVATGETTMTFRTRQFVPVFGVAFSPDGNRLVTLNGRNEAQLWNAATGELIGLTIGTSDSTVLGISPYSPDGRWFATWGGQTIRLWDGSTGASVGETMPAWDGLPRFSGDSRSLGTADGHGNVRVWDVPSGQPFTEPMQYGLGFLDFDRFSPDGRFVSAVQPERYSIWSVPPRLPEGTPVPEWLLNLATVLADKQVNDAGELIGVPNAMAQFHDVRRHIAALPVDAPLAEWGRWILDDRAARPIAPGFTLTPAQADKLAAADEAEIGAQP